MAAGATVGSNHNSRSNDGEIEAGRGFWPGLCTSVKHSSRFASYCLLAKADYRYELDITLPFCLVDDDRHGERLVLSPAFWWMHNLFALMRNESKFRSRDKRTTKTQAIEFSPFAPDTAEEIIAAIALLEEWTGAALARRGGRDPKKVPAGELRAAGAAMLEGDGDMSDIEVLGEAVERSRRPTVILKPRRAGAAYREMLLWYGARTVLEFAEAVPDPWEALLGLEGPRESSWENVGGQLIPRSKLEALLARSRGGEIRDWGAMHAEYARLAAEYPVDRARHALACLALLYPGRGVEERLRAALADTAELSRRVESAVLEGRRKDYENPFRRATYRSEAEMAAVIGLPEDNAFVRRTALEMDELRARIAGFEARLAPVPADRRKIGEFR